MLTLSKTRKTTEQPTTLFGSGSVYFTDGSRIKPGMDAGAHGARPRQAINLRHHDTELYEIHACVYERTSNKILKENPQIFIQTVNECPTKYHQRQFGNVLDAFCFSVNINGYKATKVL